MMHEEVQHWKLLWVGKRENRRLVGNLKALSKLLVKNNPKPKNKIQGSITVLARINRGYTLTCTHKQIFALNQQILLSISKSAMTCNTTNAHFFKHVYSWSVVGWTQILVSTFSVISMVLVPFRSFAYFLQGDISFNVNGSRTDHFILLHNIGSTVSEICS